MLTVSSESDGSFSADYPVHIGTLYIVKVEFPASTTGPAGGSVSIHHRDDDNNLTLVSRDENGASHTVTATGSIAGAEFIVKAAAKTLRVTGTDLGNSKTFYLSITELR